jgi:hypothetical protein
VSFRQYSSQTSEHVRAENDAPTARRCSIVFNDFREVGPIRQQSERLQKHNEISNSECVYSQLSNREVGKIIYTAPRFSLFARFLGPEPSALVKPYLGI